MTAKATKRPRRKKAVPQTNQDREEAIVRLTCSRDQEQVWVRVMDLIPLLTAIAIGQADPRFTETQRLRVWETYYALLREVNRREPGLVELLGLDQLDQLDPVAVLDDMTGCISDVEDWTNPWTLAEEGRQ